MTRFFDRMKKWKREENGEGGYADVRFVNNF